MDIKQKIGNRIRSLREQKSITQKDLAYDSDLDRSYIAGVENGKRNVSVVNIEKITNALKISLKDFYNDDSFSSFTDLQK